MSRYTSATDADRAEMLAAIGVDSIDALFADIPERLRLSEPLDLGPGLSEQEVYDELRRLAQRNVSTEDEVSFLGGGMYDHYVPALIDSIISRSEFLTPYTPYQPEVSQGGLQAMFEYQTAICELTGLPVSNASVYEGPSAVAAAGYVAKLSQPGRRRFVDLARRAPARPRDAGHAGPRVGDGRAGGPAARRGHRAARARRHGQRRDRRRSRTSSASSRISRRSPRPRTPPARWRSAPVIRCRWRCCARPASAGSTSPSGRARRSATGWTSAAPRSASSPSPRS